MPKYKSQFARLNVPHHERIPMRLRQVVTEAYVKNVLSEADLVGLGHVIGRIHDALGSDVEKTDAHLKPLFDSLKSEDNPLQAYRVLSEGLQRIDESFHPPPRLPSSAVEIEEKEETHSFARPSPAVEEREKQPEIPPRPETPSSPPDVSLRPEPLVEPQPPVSPVIPATPQRKGLTRRELLAAGLGIGGGIAASEVERRFELFSGLGRMISRFGQSVIPEAKHDFDVVVVGSEPEAVAAAISSARSGARTLLVHSHDQLGGLWTRSGLNQFDVEGEPGKPKVKPSGVFADLLSEMNIHPGYYHAAAFDPQVMEKSLRRLAAREKNLTIHDNASDYTFDVNAPPNGRRLVTGLRYQQGWRTHRVRFRQLVDGTEDADVIGAVGEKNRDYFVGSKDLLAREDVMPSTLVFRIDNVDWKALTKHLGLSSNATHAAGFHRETEAFSEKHLSNTPAELWGLNMGHAGNGTVYVNGLRLYGFNPLHPASRQEAYQLGSQLAPKIVDYFSGQLGVGAIPGFENAKFGGVADDLYVRESRHIFGQSTITARDVFYGSAPKDGVATGAYPIDLAPRRSSKNLGQMYERLAGIPLDERKIAQYGVYASRPYGIPLGATRPQRFDNVYVVGRPIACDSLAYGSVRVVPHRMPAAEAAGKHAALRAASASVGMIR